MASRQKEYIRILGEIVSYLVITEDVQLKEEQKNNEDSLLDFIQSLEQIIPKYPDIPNPYMIAKKMNKQAGNDFIRYLSDLNICVLDPPVHKEYDFPLEKLQLFFKNMSHLHKRTEIFPIKLMPDDLYMLLIIIAAGAAYLNHSMELKLERYVQQLEIGSVKEKNEDKLNDKE
jgi:hypothetical protein